jgi:hypothetical protein
MHAGQTEKDPSFRGVIGAGRADMTPEAGIYCHLWGSATHEQAERIHRPLHASALCLETTARDRRVVIATIDYCWFPSYRTLDELCAPIREEFGLGRHELLLVVTHSHAVPQIDEAYESRPGGDRIPAYRAKLRRALREAVAESISTAEPATLAWASGHCTLARTRDFPDPESGRILCGPNPAGSPDHTLLVGRVTALWDGRTIATLVNYACHPVSLGGGNRSISPDYVGRLRELLETATRGAPCLFLHGPSGNQTPRDCYADDPAVADANGEILGFAALSVLSSMLPPGKALTFKGPLSSGAQLAIWEARDVETDTTLDARVAYARLPPKQWPKIAEIDAAIASAPDRAAWTRMTRLREFVVSLEEGLGGGFPVYAVRMGGAVIVGVPAEAFTDFQIELRRRFPDIAVVVTNDTNGTYNYLPPAGYYGNGAYEQDCADFGPGALEIVTTEASRLIRGLLADSGPERHADSQPVARQDRYTWA